MPASATPAGPVSAAPPAKQEAQNGEGQRSEVRGQPEGEERESGNPTEVSNEDLARHLNLPAGVSEQLQKAHTEDTKDTKEKKKAEGPAGEGEEAEAPSSKHQAPEKQQAPNGEEEAESESSEEEESGEIRGESEGDEEEGADDDRDSIPKFIKDLEPKVRKKLEKRFGRLTRKTARLEEALDRQEQELAQYREQNGAQAQRAAEAAPQKGGILGSARTERELDGMVSYAENLIELVDNNPDGVTMGEGDQAKFHSPEELAKWKRDAEKVLMGSERRRRELREHTAARQQYDDQARKDFPEVMKKDTPEYQAAVKLAGRYPWVCQLPEANYALGLMVEGFKALNGRAGKNGANGSKSTSKSKSAEEDDLDERLTPEYQRDHIPPTAAAIPNKPQRSPASAGSNAKKVEKIAANFTRPQGATTASLASAFEALDEEEESPSRRMVAV